MSSFAALVLEVFRRAPDGGGDVSSGCRDSGCVFFYPALVFKVLQLSLKPG